MSQLFPSGGQSIEVSASASVFPMNIQDWFPLELTGWISLQSKGLSRVFSNTTVQKHEYDYDGTGYVTFYVNGGGTDEYTKIEINGVDYSNQAPHSQIEVFEHLNGWASVFEIKMFLMQIHIM